MLLNGLIVCIHRRRILSLVHEALMMIRGGLYYCNRHRAVFRLRFTADATVGSRN